MSERMMLLYHAIAFFCGFILDLILGDPEGWPHPVRWIGKLIAVLDEKMMGKMEPGTIYKKSDGKEEATDEDRKDYRKGIILVLAVVAVSAIGASIPLIIGYLIHPVCGIIFETILTWWILAVKSLRVESMAVYRRLVRRNLPAARKQVARIVGRDTDVLDEAGVARATVETIAESTCDGILAPMLYTAIGGPVLGYAAKAINTMDSMVGYKNERYLYFGRVAALTDDVINFIPARLSAYFIIAAAWVLEKTADRSAKRNAAAKKSSRKEEKKYSAKDAIRIYRRDHSHSASPNAGHPESAIAGALGIQLGGGAVYSGKFLAKEFMGEPLTKINCEDIRRANTLMFTASLIAEAAFLLVILFVSIL